MQRRRRLRKLVPDEALIRRRAAGEPLRELAPDYNVTHTTLGRYFERPDVAKQPKEAAKQLRAEERAAESRHAAQRRLEREVRRKAKEQAMTEREQAGRARAAVAEISSRRRPARTPYEAWLDERDARRPLTRSELHSTADEIAAGVVAAGGGMQAIIDATGFRTLRTSSVGSTLRSSPKRSTTTCSRRRSPRHRFREETRRVCLGGEAPPEMGAHQGRAVASGNRARDRSLSCALVPLAGSWPPPWAS
jgi:hypothetical protein